MKLKLFGVSIYVSFPWVAFLAMALVCDSSASVLICVISSLLHEIGHILTAKLKGANIKSVKVGLGDVAINADFSQLSPCGEMLVSLSGVAVNSILVIIGFVLCKLLNSDFLFKLSTVNALIGVFNLLPINGLDGGEFVFILLQKRFSLSVSEKVMLVLSFVFSVPLFAVGIAFAINSKYNYSLLFAALYLLYTLVSKEF